MLKSFAEMRKADVSQYIEKRDGLDYLNWAKCIDLLHDNGAGVVYFTPLVNENGSSLFMSSKTFTDSKGNTNNCYEVAVEIVIDDLVFVMRSPLMNGSNPVKDNSLSQQRVWNAQTRAFVKGVAIRTGLGFGLWSDDVELKPNDDDDIYRHNILTVKERVQRLYTKKHKEGKSQSDIAKSIGVPEDVVKSYFTYYDILADFENKLEKV